MTFPLPLTSEAKQVLMEALHPWRVSVKEAIQIQEGLKDRILLQNTFSNVETIGGGDVAYSKNRNLLYGAIAILSYPEMKPLEVTMALVKKPFPYIPGLFTFREGPVLVKAFEQLRRTPDVMIFDGQGIAHPRGMGLASHLGLWLNVPSIGCAKTPLIGRVRPPRSSKGTYRWLVKDGKKVGAVLRTKEKVKPLFISPGHRIDLITSIALVLDSCRGFRIPEPLRMAHQASRQMMHSS